MARGGKRNGAGRKPVWDTEQIAARVQAVSAKWWTEIESMLDSKNDGKKKFALVEINKLQIRQMTQNLDLRGNLSISLTDLFNRSHNDGG